MKPARRLLYSKLSKMIQTFLILCLTICNVGVLGDMKFRSDYKYYSQVEGWFKYHIVPANFKNARIRCHLEGGILASPLKEEMTSIMINEMKERKANALFIGIHATYSKGDFFSMEGVPLRNIPTNRGYPEIDQKNDDEDCMVIVPHGTLADVRCADVYPYMCYTKHDDKKMSSQGECGTIDTAYKYSEITGRCYKFHPIGETWSRAFMTCAAEGAFLAIINSENEAQVIRDLYSLYPNEKIVGATHNAHVGYKSDKTSNFWITVHGESLKEAGYAYWDNGQPDNGTNPLYNGAQSCGTIFRTARFDDNFCDLIAPFICEKLPDSLQ